MKCANCGKTIIPEISYSTVIVLQKVSQDTYTFFQCSDGQEFKSFKWQHFCCNVACMIEMIQKCVSEHHQESNLHEIQMGQGYTSIHKIILGAGLQCILCNNPIEDKA